MFLKLFLLLVTVPLIELVILLLLGSDRMLGPLVTIAIVIFTGITGAWLAQWQGTLAFNRIRKDIADGVMPTDSVIDAVLIFFAGAFLMTPGVLTDILGITLLTPPGRKLLKRFVTRWIKSHFRIETFNAGGASRSDDVIDSHTANDQDTTE